MAIVFGLMLNASAIAGNTRAVYTMTNAADGNEIVIYNRANDGHLALAGQVETGGVGAIHLKADGSPIPSVDLEGCR